MIGYLIWCHESWHDLKLLTWDNTIEHLQQDLHTVDNHIRSLNWCIKGLSDNPPVDEHPHKVPHNSSSHHPIIWDMPKNGPVLISLHPLAPSLGPSPKKALQYIEPPSLWPDGYMWFSLPDTEQVCLTTFWQNVPIPAEFFPGDFNQGVSLTSHTWNVGTDELCQWHFTHFIKPFVNSPEGFKFLVNIRHINKEYEKGAQCVHLDAVALFQEWYGIKHISGRQTRSLADIDNWVQNLSLLNCVNKGGLQYLITSLWQADSATKKLGKLKLVPKMLPPITTSFLLRAPTPCVYPMVVVSLPPPPPTTLSYIDNDEEMVDMGMEPTPVPPHSSWSSILSVPSASKFCSNTILLPPHLCMSSLLTMSIDPSSSGSSTFLIPLLSSPLPRPLPHT